MAFVLSVDMLIALSLDRFKPVSAQRSSELNVFNLCFQVLNGREDALHVDATPRHATSPKGQSKLDSYLQYCSSQPMMRNEDMATASDGPHAEGPGMSVSVDSEEGGWQTGNSENRQFEEASGQRAKRTKLF